MKDNIATILTQLVVVLVIAAYFIFLPTIVDTFYSEGVTHYEEYKIQDITKDSVR